ncbi:MAG: NfrA family protein, partial [Deefgea sp.]
WYELALLHQREQRHAQQGEALAQAVKRAPDNALFRAEYGFWLISTEQHVAALDNLQHAIELDPTRIELQPQIAFLQMQQGNNEAAIIDLRASIDQYAAIQERMGISGDAAAQQLFNWQRNVQTLEDRWNWIINTQIRLDSGPNTNNATSPVQFGQYNGYINAAITYRLDPIWDPARPTWIFARANQGLKDQSLNTTPDNTFGLGISQRLLKNHMALASAEWLHRSEATYQDDIMLRLSGSHSINTDWQPTGDSWINFNLYGDIAWLVRAESYYLTTSVEVGQQYRLPWLEGKSSLMPFISSIATANNDNPTHTVVSRIDVGAGLALQTWHGADPWRAPDLRQRISLEVRQAIGGNTDDRSAVLFRWGLFH